MKKLLYLLLLLPLAFLASCNSDDDFPQVKLTLSVDNVYQADTNGDFYYIKDVENPVIIEGLTAQTLIDGKNAAVTNVFYSINGLPLPFASATDETPAKPVIPSEYLKEGKNVLRINATVLQVDKSIAQCSLDIPIITVLSEDNLPESVDKSESGVHSISINIQPKK